MIDRRHCSARRRSAWPDSTTDRTAAICCQLKFAKVWTIFCALRYNSIIIVICCHILFLQCIQYVCILIWNNTDCPYCIVFIYSAFYNACGTAVCLDRSAVTSTHNYMINIAIRSLIKDQIARQCIFYRYFGGTFCLVFRHTRNAVTKFCINALYKTGAVCPFCQTGTSPYIRITQELLRIF